MSDASSAGAQHHHQHARASHPAGFPRSGPKCHPVKVLFSAGRTGMGLRRRRGSVPPPRSLRAPQGGGPAWRAQLRASVPHSSRLPCPVTSLLSRASRSFTTPENPAHHPHLPQFPQLSAAAGPHPGASPTQLLPATKAPQTPPAPRHAACRAGGPVPLTKSKMSPRSCGAGRAGSSRARSRQRGSTLAMVGSPVPRPRGRRGIYGGRLRQLTRLLLSRSNSWRRGRAAMPMPGGVAMGTAHSVPG